MLPRNVLYPIAVLEFPVVLLSKAFAPSAVFLTPVVLACRLPPPMAVLVAIFPPPLPTVSEFIVASVVVEKDPVTCKEPEMIADPVYGKGSLPDPVSTVIGNVLPSPLVNVIVLVDTEAVNKREPVSVGTTFRAKDAVSANDELMAKDAVSAKLAVPINEAAVTEVVTLREFRAASDPEIMTFFQFGIYNSLLW